MFQNYVKVALRHLVRHKLFAAINITGLGLGMACCLLILIFVRHELSFDRHVPDADRIYRVTYHATNGNDYARIPPPIAPLLPDFFSEVETAARAFAGDLSVRVPATAGRTEEAAFEEPRVTFVDSTFFDVFPLTFIHGDPTQRLTEPFTVLLTEEVAARYFGDANPVGQAIVLEGAYTFTVVGVVQDFPTNAHLHVNLLLPYDNMYDVVGAQAGAAMRQNLAANWVISHSFTYVKLKPGTAPARVEQRFEALVAQHAPPQLQVGQAFSLTPLLDIHLHTPDVYLQPEPQGDIQYVYVFGAVAFLTLLLPCFNFINLATAQSIGRTLEIGMRQALGAHRRQLFGQFLGESLVVCTLAFGVALGLAGLGLPYVGELLQRDLTPALLWDPLVIAGFGMVLLVTGLLGGSYPAFVIARTDIVPALRRRVAVVPGRGFSLRKVLVVLQFAISITLIGGTALIFQQLHYMLNRPLGYETEGVVAVPLFSQNMLTIFSGVDEEMRSRLNAFEETIAENPRVRGATLSRSAPGLGIVARMVTFEGATSDDPIFVPSMAVDYDFLDFYGLELVAGRSFDQARGTDHLDAFIVNETAVREFGWDRPAEALGKAINLEGKEGQVVGVVRDYHFVSLQNPVGAMLMEINVPAFRTVSIRVAADDLPATLGYLEDVWMQFFPEQAFDYTFLDDQLGNVYEAQQRFGGLLRLFALLGVVISCLGAYGLVMYSTRQRRREIGVRKVLGASLPQILGLLYRELAVLFVAGLVIAAPAIYVAGQWWLEDFTYRIDPGPGVVLLSGALMLALAALTISYQSVKAALVNPVDCLRSE